tara:strand:- start:910 stop:1047 length:138 start_codon:yes stop_codon:yes gene_type:complete
MGSYTLYGDNIHGYDKPLGISFNEDGKIFTINDKWRNWISRRYDY